VTDTTQRPGPVRSVAVVAKLGPPEAVRLASEVGDWLARRGIEVRFDSETATALGKDNGLPRDHLSEGLDLVLVAGGDGTLLSVARAAAPLGVPILGVNLGGLGFLTELQPDELYDHLDDVVHGRYRVEERQTLRVRYRRGGRTLKEYALLNDVVITKAALARMIDVAVRIDDDEVVTYTSDGLVVATPTGSTAYSLSAGGPILDPRMRAFVIAPICPHSMTYRPLVVPASVRIRLGLGDTREEVFLTLDGQVGFPMEPEDTVVIDNHPCPVRLVKVANRPFFEVLRRKLRWGER
jgi:NAD+ kinase